MMEIKLPPPRLEMLSSQKLGHFNPSAGQVFWVRPAMKKQFHVVTSAAFSSST